MSTIKKLSKLEILNETIQFYGEDKTRRAVEGDICLYNTNDGRHCAVGRCFVKSIQTLGTNFEQNEGTTPDMIPNFDKKLRVKYRGHDTIFWQYLQNLHDDEYVWGKNGLTEIGKLKVKDFKERFDIVD